MKRLYKYRNVCLQVYTLIQKNDELPTQRKVNILQIIFNNLFWPAGTMAVWRELFVIYCVFCFCFFISCFMPFFSLYVFMHRKYTIAFMLSHGLCVKDSLYLWNSFEINNIWNNNHQFIIINRKCFNSWFDFFIYFYYSAHSLVIDIKSWVLVMFVRSSMTQAPAPLLSVQTSLSDGGW